MDKVFVWGYVGHNVLADENMFPNFVKKIEFGNSFLYVPKSALVYEALIEYRINNRRYQEVMPIVLTEKLDDKLWHSGNLPQRVMGFNPLMFVRHLLRLNQIPASRCRILEIKGAPEHEK